MINRRRLLQEKDFKADKGSLTKAHTATENSDNTVDDNSIMQRKQENRSNLKTVFLYTLQGTNLRERLSLN